MIRVRGGYSFREATGSIDDVISRLKEIGATEAPITDRASTFGFQRWTKAARKAGLRPIYGVELAVTQSPNEKKPTYDYVTFVAKTEVAPLNRLVETATQQFRYRPLLTEVQAHAVEGVYRILGHRAQIQALEPHPDTFLALGPSTSMGLAKLAIERGIPFIASSDNRYPRAEDRGFYEVLVGRNAETQTYPQHILDESEWAASIRRLKLSDARIADAWNAAIRVRAGSTAELIKAEFARPPRPATLRAMSEAGACDLGIDLSDPVYRDRLDRELSLIEAKRFEDYFYLVADLCQWARARMIVGPARGSSCGSLVCYLLKITTVDPIPFGLIFERFIDVNRSDLPDIDIDFSDQQRPMVFDYLRDTYGPERVARLGTVAMFKPRSALQEAGGALRIPRFKTEPVADSLIIRPDGDARALNTLEDTLATMPAGQDLAKAHPEIRVATRFEGHPRHYCLKGDTTIKIGQTGSNLPGEVSIADLHRMYVSQPSEDTRRRGRMPWLVSMEEDGRCRKQRAAKIWFAGVKRCVRATFADGSVVECTPEHRFEIDGKWLPISHASYGSLFRRTEIHIPGGKKGWPVGSKRPDMANPAGGPYRLGPEHVNFRNGLNGLIRDQRAHFAGMQCESCDRPGEDLHHRDMEGGRIRPADVEWLCKSCHRLRHKDDQKRWSKGISTKLVALVSIEDIGEHPTYDIEMPVHHNFVLGNGIVASNSQHAAGVVISEQPVIEIVAVDRRTGATMCDKKDAEDGYGLLKIDALGLTQLSVFEDALELANLPRDALEKVPLDDPAAFEILNDRKWSGIFQFNGGALQGITKQFVASKFEDISNVTALARPGPMQSGGAQDWVRRRNGGRVEYPHPMFEPFLAETLGVLVYQEQVMHIGREIGGLSWEDVSALRKLMSKTMGREALGKYETPWKAGAIEKGLEPAVADKVWNDLVTFGQYGFNKSHSVAYAMISYWCLWLKAHHPFEFAAATLSHEPDPVKQIKILREMNAEGFGYIPIDAELSGEKWTVGSKDGKRVLVGPLSVVKGIGPKMLSDIVGRRNRREKLTDRQRKLLEAPKTEIDSLWPIRDAFARILPDPAARNINTPPTRISEITSADKDNTVVVFCVIESMKPSDENAPDKVERRGGRVYDAPTTALNLTLADDTDTIFAKIGRFDYEKLGGPVIARGKGPRSLYAVKGVVWGSDDFRMISVKMIRYIGDIEDAAPAAAAA